MSTPIKLPPLPPRYKNHAGQWIDVDDVSARDKEIVRCVLEAAAKVLTDHQIPVGNSAAGELACEWTYDALKECRDKIKSLEFTP